MPAALSPDAAAAVAALTAAGSDVDALAAAIARGAALDATPGDGRQALRGELKDKRGGSDQRERRTRRVEKG
jgi:hypothetical protein